MGRDLVLGRLQLWPSRRSTRMMGDLLFEYRYLFQENWSKCVAWAEDVT